MEARPEFTVIAGPNGAGKSRMGRTVDWWYSSRRVTKTERKCNFIT